MTERERLIEILKDSDACEYFMPYKIFKLAEHLLNYGVIVPPCELGDNLFYVKDGRVTCATVDRINFETYGDKDCPDVFTQIDGYGYSVGFEDVGRLVFTTPEEAEKALKESDK